MIIGRRARRLAAAAGIVLIAAATAIGQESDVERLLAQADEFVDKNEFKPARGSFIEAAAISKSALNLSRATFGVALCYFHEGDLAGSAEWLEKLSDVDPKKRISELFYPQEFVDLFNRIMTKGGTRETVPPKPAPPPPDKPKAADEKAVAKSRETAAGRPRPSLSTAAPSPEIPISPERPGGHWEINVHYSSWSVDPIMSIFESSLIDEIGKELQNEVVKKVGASYAGLVKELFTPTLSLNSEGSNYGFEVRYYARGRAGTFSFGIGVEQTRIRLGLGGMIKQQFTIGSIAAAEAEAFIETNPVSPHLSFRWEIGRPAARLKPYLVFGLGIAPLVGTFTYSYSGIYQFGSVSDTIGDSKTKTFVELSEDIDFDIPDYIAVIQLHLGLKIEIFKGLMILGEAGIWDGLLLRGGLGFRF
jgi:hypothetical protein